MVRISTTDSLEHVYEISWNFLKVSFRIIIYFILHDLFNKPKLQNDFFHRKKSKNPLNLIQINTNI